MKKCLSLFLTAIVCLVGVKTANAMTESELKAKLEKTYTINGENYKLPNELKISMQRYLDEYDVSDADCDYISKAMDDAIDIVKESGVTDLEKLSDGDTAKIKSLVEGINNNTTVKLTIKDGNLTVYKPDGGVFTVVNDLVKQTSNTVDSLAIWAGVAALIVVAGASVVVYRAKTSK